MIKSCIKTAFIILLFNISTGCSSKNYPVGNYQNKAIAVDGDLKEWENPQRFACPDGKVHYNVTNDNENLYVCLETQDANTVIKILRGGINLYIDPRVILLNHIMCKALSITSPEVAI